MKKINLDLYADYLCITFKKHGKLMPTLKIHEKHEF